jgi:dihydrofolate reductase
MIKAIVACDQAGGIGLDGSMPWPHNKTDLQNFKAVTTGHAVVMGSQTWASLPRSLEDRMQYICTRKLRVEPKITYNARTITGDIPTLLQELEYHHKIVWVIGGLDIYKQAWPVIQEWNVTIHPDLYTVDKRINLQAIYDEFDLVHSYSKAGLQFKILKKGA